MAIIWVGTGRFSAYIGPVQDYIDRVVAADVAAGNTLGLEVGVRDAYDVFIRACLGTGELGSSGGVLSQADSIIKAAPIMAGARTLAGALVPLVGAALTNFNFVAGDYNRKTGLVGNRSNKSLRTGLRANALSNTSHHLFFNGSSFRVTPPGGPSFVLGGVYDGANITSLLDVVELIGSIVRRETRSGTAGNISGSSATIENSITSNGSISMSRTSSTELRLYQNGVSVAVATNNNTPALPNVPFGVFARNNNGTFSEFVDSRLSFFSIGDGLSETAMAALHSRTTTLINALAVAIP